MAQDGIIICLLDEDPQLFIKDKSSLYLKCLPSCSICRNPLRTFKLNVKFKKHWYSAWAGHLAWGQGPSLSPLSTVDGHQVFTLTPLQPGKDETDRYTVTEGYYFHDIKKSLKMYCERPQKFLLY